MWATCGGASHVHWQGDAPGVHSKVGDKFLEGAVLPNDGAGHLECLSTFVALCVCAER